MPAPDNRPPAARPPSRGWIIPVTIALVLVLGLVTKLFLRHPKETSSGPAASPSTAETTPAPTAAVNEPSATPTASTTAGEPGATPAESHFHPPKVLTTKPVTYPEQAFLNRVEGTVLVKFFIDDAGKQSKPPAVQRSSGSVMLDAVALEYDLRQWTFQPASLDGTPVPGTVEKEFEFHLDPAGQRALAEKRLAAKIGTPDAPYPKEALALKPQGSCTISVTWTKGGLVDRIVLTKASGSNILDRTALRFAYENWRVDPKGVVEKQEFSKIMTFTPPTGPGDTPPPLLPADSPIVAAPTIAPATPTP